MTAPTFGRARAKSAATASPTRVRLIDPSMLPEKGINYCLNHLRRMWKAEKPAFPKPIWLSKRKIAWPEKVIDDWIAEKIAEAELKKSA
jgi:hypothetical protein